jgi:hypothetical protein
VDKFVELPKIKGQDIFVYIKKYAFDSSESISSVIQNYLYYNCTLLPPKGKTIITNLIVIF